MLLDCDFHIHGRYSAATSKNMTLENISVQGRKITNEKELKLFSQHAEDIHFK